METHDDPLPSAADAAVSTRVLHSGLTKQIIGSMYDVHNVFGSGFLESVYANALAAELRARRLRVERNVAFELFYRGTRVGRYVADLIVEGTVVVETKVARSIESVHKAQLLNYLRASGLEVGLVLNFGASAQFKRVIATPRRSEVTSRRELVDGNDNSENNNKS